MDEDYNELEMQCNNCLLKFYATDLQMHPERNELVCSNCITMGGRVTILKDKPLEPRRKPFDQETIIPLPSRPSSPFPGLPEGYAAFKCDACRYVFNRRTNFGGVCPYCSKKTVRMLKASEVKG